MKICYVLKVLTLLLVLLLVRAHRKEAYVVISVFYAISSILTVSYNYTKTTVPSTKREECIFLSFCIICTQID